MQPLPARLGGRGCMWESFPFWANRTRREKGMRIQSYSTESRSAFPCAKDFLIGQSSRADGASINPSSLRTLVYAYVMIITAAQVVASGIARSAESLQAIDKKCWSSTPRTFQKFHPGFGERLICVRCPCCRKRYLPRRRPMQNVGRWRRCDGLEGK